MFTASSQLNVILICGPTGMRKAIDGLSNIVAYDLEKEPSGEHVFVFFGRACNKIKILQWAHNRFWLHYKEAPLYPMLKRLCRNTIVLYLINL